MVDDIFNTFFPCPNDNPAHGGSRESGKGHHVDQVGDHVTAEQRDVIDVDTFEFIDIDEKEEGHLNRHRKYADGTLFVDSENHTHGIDERRETESVNRNIPRSGHDKADVKHKRHQAFCKRHRQDRTSRARESLESERAAAESWIPLRAIF